MRMHRVKRRFKKRKSVFKKRLFWDFVLGIVFLASVFYLLFLSPAFGLQKIKIVALNNIYPVRIYNSAAANLGRSLFLLRIDDLKNEILKEFPEIKTVELKREFPRTLFLEVQKRTPAALYCFTPTPNKVVWGLSTSSDITRGNCSSIDSTGVKWEKFSNEQEGLAVIFSRKEIISKKEMEQILGVQQQLERGLQIQIEKFVITEQERLNVETAEGWEIYFDLREDIELALTKLKLLLEKEIPQDKRKNLQYIDLRFTKAYYK